MCRLCKNHTHFVASIIAVSYIRRLIGRVSTSPLCVFGTKGIKHSFAKLISTRIIQKKLKAFQQRPQKVKKKLLSGTTSMRNHFAMRHHCAYVICGYIHLNLYAAL